MLGDEQENFRAGLWVTRLGSSAIRSQSRTLSQLRADVDEGDEPPGSLAWSIYPHGFPHRSCIASSTEETVCPVNGERRPAG